MTKHFDDLKQWIGNMTALIEQNIEPEHEHFILFLNEPALALQIVELLDSLDEKESTVESSYYSYYIFAIDICVAQLQSGLEAGNKLASNLLNQLMNNLAKIINTGKHSLSFWLPVLNAFYDVQVELSIKLRDAYFNLAKYDNEIELDDDDNLDVMRNMIAEFSDLSVFDIAGNFFAQSYAMPTDFFSDLMLDLYSIEEGHDIALFAFVHPKQEVRDMVVITFDGLVKTITLSPISLSRLRIIKNWHPSNYHDQFERWIKIQRMKGVVFHTPTPIPIVHIKASEVDGSGTQGLFIHMRQGKTNYLCGMLFKQDMGMRDIWITPPLSASDIKKYYVDIFSDDSVTLREVDKNYFVIMAEHFLAITLEQGNMPDLHLLQMQELLGIYLSPKLIDIDATVEALSVQILPFTPDIIRLSFKRSKAWFHTQDFTQSWYIENPNVDKLVNRCSNFVDGVKVCAIKDAIHSVLLQEMEVHRRKWLFHFLRTTLWLKAHSRKHERTWRDSFFITYAIYSGMPLSSIPALKEIGHKSVFNSIQTMNERRTHLHKET